MRILVVCGAGASSTFVVQRLRRAASRRSIALHAEACSVSELSRHLDQTDVLLVGPHVSGMVGSMPGSRGSGATGSMNAAERASGPRVHELPADIFTDLSGDRVLEIALGGEALGGGALNDEAMVDTDQQPGSMPVPTEGDEMNTAVVERTVRVGSSHGLHARPAKLFAQAAADAGMPVTISKAGGRPMNAASILAVVSLRVEHGDEVSLSAEGAGADAVLDRLADILATDHDA